MSKIKIELMVLAASTLVFRAVTKETSKCGD